ncbi:MAG: cupin domain-containing protein [Treponema sp.]|jgi:mannose-6-phosphate isomerase-like protein (cupin superfamily)|nr:cupin domain-containing protein [Treponema sp.]
MKENSISSEEEKRLTEAREKSPYVLTLEKNGFDYPIPDLIGASRFIMVDRDTVGSKELSFMYSKFDGKTSIHHKHKHDDCEEVMYIASGRGVGGVGDHESIQQAGDVIFVPRGAVHWFYNPFDEPLEMWTVYSKPSLRAAGYSLESSGYSNVGAQVESRQFDR